MKFLFQRKQHAYFVYMEQSGQWNQRTRFFKATFAFE
jgi:hypothetical protein